MYFQILNLRGNIFAKFKTASNCLWWPGTTSSDLRSMKGIMIMRRAKGLKVEMTFPRYIDDETISIKKDLGQTKMTSQMVFRSDAGPRMGVRMWPKALHPSHLPYSPRQPSPNPGKNGSSSECATLLLPPFLLLLPPFPPLLLPLPYYPPSNSPHRHTSIWRRYGTVLSISYQKSHFGRCCQENFSQLNWKFAKCY